MLDEYIGNDTASEFMQGLIKLWIKYQMEKENQTDNSLENDEQTSEIVLPENEDQAIREFIADKTAQAVADAIVERVDTRFDSMIHDAIYESVYTSMMGNEGFLDGMLEEMIPGYGDLSGILGGLGQ